MLAASTAGSDRRFLHFHRASHPPARIASKTMSLNALLSLLIQFQRYCILTEAAVSFFRLQPPQKGLHALNSFLAKIYGVRKVHKKRENRTGLSCIQELNSNRGIQAEPKPKMNRRCHVAAGTLSDGSTCVHICRPIRPAWKRRSKKGRIAPSSASPVRRILSIVKNAYDSFSSTTFFQQRHRLLNIINEPGA